MHNIYLPNFTFFTVKAPSIYIIYHIYQTLFPYQNKHQNQKVTINHMYNKKQNGNGGGEGLKAKKAR